MPTLETFRGVYIWKYVPSLPAAVVFAALFTAVSVAHTWRMVKTRMWFCLPFVVGGFFEVIGYVFRAAGTNNTGSLLPYLMQSNFLLLPPVLFAASLYMVYSRVVRAVDGVRFSPMPPRWTTAVFVVGDLLCLNIQSTGGGMLAKTESANTGDHIIVTGLVLQVLVFCCFLVNCLIFHRRFHAHAAAAGTATISNAPWQACLHMLYATSFFILVRNIYRVVEFITGQDGYLLEHEWPTYAFDGALMLLVMIGFFVWYPSQLRPIQRDTMIELRSVNEASPPPVRAAKSRNGREWRCS